MQHSQETDIHAPVGFEPTIPASKQPQTHPLDSTATGIGRILPVLNNLMVHTHVLIMTTHNE